MVLDRNQGNAAEVQDVPWPLEDLLLLLVQTCTGLCKSSAPGRSGDTVSLLSTRIPGSPSVSDFWLQLPVDMFDMLTCLQLPVTNFVDLGASCGQGTGHLYPQPGC